MTKDQRVAAAVANKLLGVKLYQCTECDFGTDNCNELHMIGDVLGRVASGELMPEGKCPRCETLIPAADDDVWCHPLVELLRRRGYTVTEPEA